MLNRLVFSRIIYRHLSGKTPAVEIFLL